ncbi:hypothetical protein [Streptomyces sp. NBC_01750]|nr:hypothetical protein [Streptomyces sp. NBC_01750]WSD36758.1 hypothetical protein OG966_35505 [Streptomyces sp. NBC_01750]
MPEKQARGFLHVGHALHVGHVGHVAADPAPTPQEQDPGDGALAVKAGL